MTRDDWIAVFFSLVTASVLFTLYYWVFKPEIVLNPLFTSTCPDGWVYNESTYMCSPAYTTTCKPYDPRTQPITDPCDFATQCGTTWAGYC
jgi:hypothetical protein